MKTELPSGWMWVHYGEPFTGGEFPIFRAERRVVGPPGRNLKRCDCPVKGKVTADRAREIVVFGCWRDESDQRGMDLVETDARDAHADLARNILGPDMRVYLGTTQMGSSQVSVRLVDWSVEVE